MKKNIYLVLIALLMSTSSILAEDNGTVEIVSASYQLVMVKDENGTLVETWPLTTRVVPGTVVKYVNTIVNTTDNNISDVKVSNPINTNLMYIDTTALSELNATILYSIDKGQIYDIPEHLMIGEGKKRRKALPEEYNAIEWIVKSVPADTNCSVSFKVKLK